MPDEWWQRQLARDWVNVGKGHNPTIWFDVLDNDPEGPESPKDNEPGPDGAATRRINGSFDIRQRGDITPWIGYAPVPFVINDFMEQGAVTLLAGEGGAGKSYVALTAGALPGRGDGDTLLRQADTAGAGRLPVCGRLPGGHSSPSGPAMQGHRR